MTDADELQRARQRFFNKANPKTKGARVKAGMTVDAPKLERATPARLLDLLAPRPAANGKSESSALAGLVRANMANGEIELTFAPPWRALDPLQWRDCDDAELQAHLETFYGLKAPLTAVETAVRAAAARNRYNPLREWLLSLEWDGTPRVERFFVDFCGAVESEYMRAISRVFFVGAVARAMCPGTKHDLMVILEGPQGTFKSTALRILVGDAYFSDSTPDLAHLRETGEQLRGVWGMEFSELSGLSSPGVNRVKHVLSQTTDRYRPAYARHVETVPRMTFFVGTTNPDATGAYLRDTTGNRRFLPVKVKFCDVDAIAREREQLWAEAVRMYSEKVPHWLTPDDGEALVQAEQETAARVKESPWVARTAEYVASNPDKREMATADVFFIATGRWPQEHDSPDLRGIAEGFRALGWQYDEHLGDKRTRRGWRRPG